MAHFRLAIQRLELQHRPEGATIPPQPKVVECPGNRALTGVLGRGTLFGRSTLRPRGGTGLRGILQLREGPKITANRSACAQ